jgi:hypothetical protein
MGEQREAELEQEVARLKAMITRPRACAFPGCLRPYLSLGYCGAHYAQHKAGKPLREPRRWHSGQDVATRLRSNATSQGECLVFAAEAIWDEGRRRRPAVAAWELAYGALRENQDVYPTCGSRRCVRPEHLRVRAVRPRRAHG